MSDEIFRRLDAIDARLSAIEQRLDSLEEAPKLRAQLDHAEESRRQLAEQTGYLIETLSDARRAIRQMKQNQQ